MLISVALIKGHAQICLNRMSSISGAVKFVNFMEPLLCPCNSTLGQGLQTSTFPGEVIFSIALAILGLILFALLIGNMQVKLLPISYPFGLN